MSTVMAATKCQCPLAGWCATHYRDMPESRWAECHGSDAYFDVYAAQHQRVRAGEEAQPLPVYWVDDNAVYNPVPSQQTGLGDVIALAAKVTGISLLTKVYTKVTGKSCGCPHRRQKLNDLFPIKLPNWLRRR